MKNNTYNLQDVADFLKKNNRSEEGAALQRYLDNKYCVSKDQFPERSMALGSMNYGGTREGNKYWQEVGRFLDNKEYNIEPMVVYNPGAVAANFDVNIDFYQDAIQKLKLNVEEDVDPDEQQQEEDWINDLADDVPQAPVAMVFEKDPGLIMSQEDYQKFLDEHTHSI